VGGNDWTYGRGKAFSQLHFWHPIQSLHL
jgi:hypothetical protein